MDDQIEQMVSLRHTRTEQRVVVSLRSYQRQWAHRYRNWQMVRGSSVLRPCLTVSECLLTQNKPAPVPRRSAL